MRIFEAAVFNQKVRDCLSIGEQHKDFTDDWADVHYIEIRARSEAEAKQQALKKFPPDKGFVLREIEEIKEFF